MPEEQKLGFTNPSLCERVHEVVVGYKDFIQSLSTHNPDVVKTKAAELEALVHNLVHI